MPTPFKSTSTAYESSHIVKASPGILYGIAGYNSSNSAVFIQIFDSTTVPNDGTAPDFIIYTSASGNYSVDFGIYGRPMSTGIVFVSSSTGPIKTITGNTAWFDGIYI